MMPHFILIYETCIRGKKCHESAFYRRLSVIGLQNHVGLFDTEKGRLQLTIPEDTFGLQGSVQNHVGSSDTEILKTKHGCHHFLFFF